MGVVFVQLGRAVKHGCSDCVIICRLINILFEQGESFPDSHCGVAWAAPLFWSLCVSHCAEIPLLPSVKVGRMLRLNQCRPLLSQMKNLCPGRDSFGQFLAGPGCLG